ncbi:MAG: imidazole glycerol phosphate synthase subunit HisH [Ruminococcaceae bacterium]|nr:imidazole glycerol phosphate synthase subunit HisH [Oscillospiraceae bacterium]
MSYTAIIDYGVGNLFSLSSSLRFIGSEAVVTGDRDVIRRADRIILPGVGAFGDAADKLRATGLVPVLNEEVAAGKPLMGICLGMQMLFEKSYEFGEHEGLGYIGGSVCPMEPDLAAMGDARKIPHMGWNDLSVRHPECPILKYTPNGAFVYFVHSFYAKDCDSAIMADANYGVTVPAVVANGNVYGCQFHPEKSGQVGLAILRAFTELGGNA